MARKRRFNLTGWKKLKEKEIPSWVFKVAYKKSIKHPRWHYFILKGKSYQYYVEHLGHRNFGSVYRKSGYKHKAVRMQKAVKTLLFVLVPIFTFIFVLLSIEYLFFRDFYIPTIYALVAIGTIYFDYKLFIWSSRIRVRSELRLFGLKVLAGLVVGLGAFCLYLAAASVLWPLMFLQSPLRDPVITSLGIFFGLLGLGLLLLGSYLFFRFMRRAGIIIFPR